MNFISYAQNFEDVMLWRALKNVKNGFYIDVGAQDPIVDSVSLAFYEHGWRGIHVEPTKQYSDKLKFARPDESVMQIAIGSGNHLLTFFEFSDTGLSTADAFVAQSHIEKGFSAYSTTVPVLSMDGLLAKTEGKDVHWFKIDVEGFERQVLESWTYSDVRPWILVIESTKPLSQELSHFEWDELVLKKGYSFVYFDGLNRFYVSEAHPELIQAFQSPPNVFDGFILSGTSTQPFCKLVEARAQQAEAKAQQAEAKAQQAEAKAQQFSTQLNTITGSRSWQLTKPLRWLSSQLRLLKSEGIKARTKAFLKKIIFKTNAKLNQSLCRWKAKDVMELDNLSPRARQIYVEINQGIERKKKEKE